MATIPNEEKVFMVSNGTNTTYSGSASLKAMQEWYTMQDVTDTVKPYKVFTAFLEQSGDDNPGTKTEGTLKIGFTYYIASSGGGDDFSNVGGPKITFNEEWVGTYFVATGETPANWTNDTELAYSYGAPLAKVLENTIGDIWFTYSDVGIYTISSDSLFTDEKTIGFITFNNNGNFGLSDKPFLALSYNTSDIYISTAIDGIPSDGVLSATPIEIRVYN